MRGRGAAAPAEPRREREVSAAPPATGPARGGGVSVPLLSCPLGTGGSGVGGVTVQLSTGAAQRGGGGGGAGGGAAALPVCVWPGTVL